VKADDIAEALAPIAPPCFETRSSWVSYVRAAAYAHHKGDAAGPLVFTRGVIAINAEVDLATASPHGNVPPLLIDKGRAVHFNPAFSYCGECEFAFRSAKQRQGKCKPTYLRDLLTTKETP
jgi:hypothetical protein